MQGVLERLEELRLLPVVTLDDEAHAEPLAEVFVGAGLPCLEITFRTPSAEEGLRRIAALGQDILVGAGTVLNAATARRAVDLGARFLVSPGLDEGTVRAAQELGVPILPGIATPTELQRAAGLGLDRVKFFPAENMGGLAMLSALSAPFPEMKFVPTGGIHAGNLRAWLSRPEVSFCGGSWLAPRNEDPRTSGEAIRERIEQARALMP